MPELPEVEQLRRSLTPHLAGARIDRAMLHRRDVLTIETRRSQRGTREAMLHGATIDRLDRRGKQLTIIARDGRVLCVHLGMSGRLQFYPAGQRITPADHVHARWTLADGGGVLAFRDPRRFGGLWSFATGNDLITRRWSLIGPDALESSEDVVAATLRHAFSRSVRALKAVLLDQAVIAGIGNIYADEICHRAEVPPACPVNLLADDADRIDSLARAIRQVLTEAVTAGGSTLRDYVDGDGLAGQAVSLHRVYGRGGQPCLACGTPLRRMTLAQRTTTWCPTCQPAQSARKARQQRAASFEVVHNSSHRMWKTYEPPFRNRAESADE